MEIDEGKFLAHYGVMRRSGRYPWGSGGDESDEERNSTFLSAVETMRKQHGMSESEIARAFDMTTTQLRDAKSIAKNERKQARIAQATALRDHGYSYVAIGKKMGIPEPTIRAMLAEGEKDKLDILHNTADTLRRTVDEKQYVDVGIGVERHMAISRDKLNKSLALLKEEGYVVHNVSIDQVGTGKKTTVKVLAAPGTTWGEVYKNRDNIQPVVDYSEDGGRTYDRILPPLSIDSKRVAVRYADQGGAAADGVIYVRPGVKDVELGSARYAQVRIAVDGSHYLKGMAMYKDDLPAGVDLMFNTNKHDTGNKLDAMKSMKNDPNDPFGALISRQIQEGEPGKKRVTSAMNIVNGEGDWEKWSKSLSSQMLSKQSPKLASEQLDMAYKNKKDEFDAIMAVDNPAVRRKLLQTFSDSADSAAVSLKAAALPRQGSHVILPIDSMKPTEIYAPNFKPGERVVLIRYPHGGKFEIPELTVNNNHPEAKRLLGQAKDAVGIHSSVAERLSGADFDGDTVLVIPNNDGKIKSEPALQGLKNFDPKHSYPPYDGMPTMDGGVWSSAEGRPVFKPGKKPSSKVKGIEMGKVSNLITDMTIRGATNSELARAVRHSMVVIDAEKHSLNWKESEQANGIKQLKAKYQKRPDGKPGGASTLISKAGAEIRVNDLKGRPAEEGGPIDKVTGKKVYSQTPQTYLNRKGETVIKERKSERLAETDNAFTLSSGTPIEEIYAAHSNRMKDLANQARLEMVHTKSTPYSPEAKVKYDEQVKTLEAKLHLALRNSPLERQAMIVANSIIKVKKQAHPDMDPSDLKKIRSLALTDARNRVGAKKAQIEITPAEWEAIQAGAITNNKLTQILNNADLDKVKELATPKERRKLTGDKKDRAVIMLRNGYTQADVADALGVSLSTLKRSLAESDE